MKVLFILHNDDLALLKADWIAARYPLAGYILVKETRAPRRFQWYLRGMI